MAQASQGHLHRQSPETVARNAWTGRKPSHLQTKAMLLVKLCFPRLWGLKPCSLSLHVVPPAENPCPKHLYMCRSSSSPQPFNLVFFENRLSMISVFLFLFIFGTNGGLVSLCCTPGLVSSSWCVQNWLFPVGSWSR